jgi:hypothetical protein
LSKELLKFKNIKNKVKFKENNMNSRLKINFNINTLSLTLKTIIDNFPNLIMTKNFILEKIIAFKIIIKSKTIPNA